MAEVNRKQGENEAIQILQKKGYEFDLDYKDQNSGESMPDLKYKDGRYLEVTHIEFVSQFYLVMQLILLPEEFFLYFICVFNLFQSTLLFVISVLPSLTYILLHQGETTDYLLFLGDIVRLFCLDFFHTVPY